MRSRRTPDFRSSLSFLLLASFASVAGAAPPTVTATSATADFEGTVAPLLKQFCYDCHGADVQEGKLRLDALRPPIADGWDSALWQSVRTRLATGEMPPAHAPQLAAAQRAALVRWLGERLIDAARLPRHARSAAPPSQGNRVDHDLLFGPHAESIVAASPAREWRASPPIYFALLRDLDPEMSAFNGRPEYQVRSALRRFTIRYSQPFSVPTTGFSDFSGTFALDQPTAEVLVRNAKELVKCQSEWRVDKEGNPEIDKRTGRLVAKGGAGTPAEFLLLMDTRTPPTFESMEAAIRKQFALVVQREPSDDELSRFLAMMQRNIAEAGQVEGVRGTLAAVVLLRETVFRSEMGLGPADEFGRQMIGPREAAYAIAFALTDRRPDEPLLAAAREGRLASREQVREEVERILGDDKIPKPRLLRFFQEYFGYTGALVAFKDDQTVRAFQAAFGLQKDKFRYVPEVFVRDTDQLVQYILAADRNVFEELLSTNKAFVNFNPERPDRPYNTYAQQSGFEPAYNLTAWPQQQPAELPKEQRAGILTQPSWLIHQSFNERTDPIHRGKWIREHLLGTAMPGVPTSVDATIPDDPHQTVRERLTGTQKEYCWNCHRKMNPLGLPLEMFDAFGRVRTEELGRPLDSTGSVDGSGEPGLDGPVADGVELIRKLARSPRVRQVFVRHAFRYWMGRAETINDAPTLVAADRAYVESGGSMRSLITSLLTSDSFLYRVPVLDPSLAATRE